MNSFTFLFEAMKETHEKHKTKIDLDELITGPTNITLFANFLVHIIIYNTRVDILLSITD